jgi:hypothetical protein
MPILEGLKGLEPWTWENPEALLIPVVVAAKALYSQIRYNKATEKRRTSVSNVQHQQNLKGNEKTRRRQSLNPGRVGLAGAAIVATALAGAPHRTTHTPESKQNAIVIQSETSAMQLTRDIAGANGKTREQVVDEGLLKAKYPGKLTIIQPGVTSAASVSSTYNWRNKNSIDTSQVDSQDASIASTIQYAASLLPNAPTKSGKIKNSSPTKSGELIVISDGIVSDSPSTLANTAQVLHKEGVNIKFIVPGTSTGQFRIDSESPYTPSAANPGAFDAFGASRVENTTTAEATAQAINNDLGYSGAHPVEAPNEALLLEIGGLLALGGLAWSQSQRINKR